MFQKKFKTNYLFYNRFAAQAKKLDELKFCCGQLLLAGTGSEQKLCGGKEEAYGVGDLPTL